MATLSKELEIPSSQGSFSKLPSGAGDGEEAEELGFCDGSAGDSKVLVVEPPVGQQEESQ